MQNFNQPGEVIPLTAPEGGVVAGTPVLIGSLVVVPCVSAAAGAQFSAAITGVFTVPKATGATWAEGEKIYWDVADEEFNKSSSGNTLAGVAVAAAGSGDTTGVARLDGVAR
jgi:predicted RecA/RadA family phage recombinase